MPKLTIYGLLFESPTDFLKFGQPEGYALPVSQNYRVWAKVI